MIRKSCFLIFSLLLAFGRSAAALPFDDLSFKANLPVYTLEQAPADPARLYALSRDGHLLRSDDGGVAFRPLGLAPVRYPEITALVVHPVDADSLFLVSGYLTEVFASTNGGLTFSPVFLPAEANHFWLDPQQPAIWWSSRGTRLLRREPGQPWQELPEVAPLAYFGTISDLAFDPHIPGHLLAGVALGFGEPAAGIYESRDHGLTWTLRLAGQSSGQISFDPTDSSKAWAISAGADQILWRSGDGGATWQEATPPIHASFLELAFDPGHPGYLLVEGRNRHQVNRAILLSRDGGASWQAVELPRGNGLTYRLSLLGDGRWIVTGSDPGASGFFASVDTGASWRQQKVLPGRVLALALDPQDPEHAWAVDNSGVYRTTRGGASWQPVFAPDVPLATAELVVDPADNRILYLAHSRFTAGPFLWRSLDRGRTWSAALESTGAIYLASLLAGRRDGRAFVLASLSSETFEPLLWRSEDFGASWQMSQGNAAAVSAGGVVYRLSGQELLQSLDGGLSFSALADFAPLGVTPIRVVGAAGPTYVLAWELPYSPPSRLFEVVVGQPPKELRLPAIECFYWGGLLAAGSHDGELYFSPNCEPRENRLFASADAGQSWLPLRQDLPEGQFQAVEAGRDGSLWVVPGDFGIFRGRPAFAEERLYLQQDRFEITVRFKDGDGRSRPGLPRYLTEETGYFAGESPERLDLAVKILDGRGLTGAWWLYYASLTESEFDLEVRDRLLGEVKSFHHPAGSLASFGDVEALPEAAPLALRKAAPRSSAGLVGGRFQVQVEWHDFTGNTYGDGQPLPLADDTVAFRFFWPANLELIVRLEPNATPDGFRVAVAGLTNVEYILDVRDTLTGRSWSFHNPLGAFLSFKADLPGGGGPAR